MESCLEEKDLRLKGQNMVGNLATLVALLHNLFPKGRGEGNPKSFLDALLWDSAPIAGDG